MSTPCVQTRRECEATTVPFVPVQPTSASRSAGPTSRGRRGPRELPMVLGILLALNLPLFFGGSTPDWTFSPGSVRAGEWWRFFTHPLVHVSWYHFLLNAAAFACAYAELAGGRLWSRIFLLASANLGAVTAAWFTSPSIDTHGMCGLSGIGHGLTVIVGLEMWRLERDKAVRFGGLACFLLVAGKSILEAWTGNILFASWHPGSLGTPIAACHAGGVLGAVLAWFWVRADAIEARPQLAAREQEIEGCLGRAE